MLVVLVLVLSTAGHAAEQDIGREVLAASDGWGSAGSGTTGGAAADAAHVFTVTDRLGLVAALADVDPAPKIILVAGLIDGNVDDDNRALRCADYAVAGYSLNGYLAAYNPAAWGRSTRPTGELEDLRRASQLKQAARVQIRVGPNTTIVGINNDARLVGVNLVVSDVDNVIVRNLRFIDAFDCFPQWDPTDGADGNWNSQYDNISLAGATHVWVDHCAFTDGDNPDSNQATYFGRHYQVHDGELDITRGSDLVTVSWNRFEDHDKVMLIGSTDNPAVDSSKLHVTVHHNLFRNVGQRTPRVRFGQVHVYNNLYDVSSGDNYLYSWGVGVESKIVAENNAFRGVANEQVIRVFGGTAIHASGTLPDDVEQQIPTSLRTDVGWTPSLYLSVDAAQDVAALVTAGAGVR
jgi:pectate lyase